jgi:hypothetical protein
LRPNSGSQVFGRAAPSRALKVLQQKLHLQDRGADRNAANVPLEKRLRKLRAISAGVGRAAAKLYLERQQWLQKVPVPDRE